MRGKALLVRQFDNTCFLWNAPIYFKSRHNCINQEKNRPLIKKGIFGIVNEATSLKSCIFV